MYHRLIKKRILLKSFDKKKKDKNFTDKKKIKNMWADYLRSDDRTCTCGCENGQKVHSIYEVKIFF